MGPRYKQNRKNPKSVNFVDGFPFSLVIHCISKGPIPSFVTYKQTPFGYPISRPNIMYGGSGKLGRGGGGGGRGGGGGVGKRNIPSPFQPPPIHRSSPASAGRLPVGGAGAPRNRGVSSSSGAPDGGGAEETFSLVTGNPLNFAMIIKLAPDLVEEIKRVEAEGGAARIKFDANAKNSPGNVSFSVYFYLHYRLISR